MTPSENETQQRVRETLRSEVAEQRAAADTERDPDVRARRRESADIRAQVAEEEAAAISAEIAESKETALSLRIPESLSRALKTRAAAEGLPVSALVRRLLTSAVNQSETPVLTLEQVEQVARRVAHDEVQHLRDTA